MNEQLAKEQAKLDDKITELITTLQLQRFQMGDTFVKMILKTALKVSRMKAKDKEEYDRVVSRNKLLQDFCKEIGLKTKEV